MRTQFPAACGIWMSILIFLILGFIAAALTGLVAIFCAEVIAGLTRPHRDLSKASGDHPVDVRVAVLVPAHNETSA